MKLRHVSCRRPWPLLAGLVRLLSWLATHAKFPMCSRAPWISAEPETADKKRKRRDLVECSGDDAEEEHGPELRSRLANWSSGL